MPSSSSLSSVGIGIPLYWTCFEVPLSRLLRQAWGLPWVYSTPRLGIHPCPSPAPTGEIANLTCIPTTAWFWFLVFGFVYGFGGLFNVDSVHLWPLADMHSVLNISVFISLGCPSERGTLCYPQAPLQYGDWHPI